MTLSKLFAAPLVAIVALYRYGVSPLLPSCCRYQPTCSAYAIEALQRHGPLRGSVLAFRRILRCHPWGGHGFDPVPPLAQSAAQSANSSVHSSDCASNCLPNALNHPARDSAARPRLT